MAHKLFNRDGIREIAEALGLDPDKHPITEISIEWSAKDVARVGLVLEIEQQGKIVKALQRYQLVERPAPSGQESWRDKDSLL